MSLDLYADLEYTWRYESAVELFKEEILFFEVALVDVTDTFASDVTLEVVSCWTTDRPDPNAEKPSRILVDG